MKIANPKYIGANLDPTLFFHPVKAELVPKLSVWVSGKIVPLYCLIEQHSHIPRKI